MKKETMNQVIDIQCKMYDLLCKIDRASGDEKANLQREYDGYRIVLEGIVK